MMVLTPEQIRAQFPALRRVHNGQPVAYLDGPGGTQVPQRVIDAMADYLANHNANTHWNYPSSQETDALLADARQAMADLFNARPAEIAFGPNMTTLTMHLARGLARAWKPGDRIVVTELDHHGNIGPWEQIARDGGLEIVRVPFDSVTGTLEPERVVAALGPTTRLVAVGGASNALGSITDVTPICRAARSLGVTSFVDAVHLAPHAPIDVQTMGCDYLACSPYKFYGPHQGVLFGREALLASVDIPKLRPAPDQPPDRIETGTQSHEAMVGTAAAVAFLATIAPRGGRRASLVAALDELHQRGKALFRRLWEGVGRLDRVVRYGPGPETARTPTLGLVVRGVPSSEVARRLAERAIFASHGDFYAATVIERLGLGEEGLVRIGCACYTTAAEVDRVTSALEEIVRT